MQAWMACVMGAMLSISDDTRDLETFLADLGLERLAPKFASRGIMLRDVGTLGLHHLHDLELNAQEKKLILNAIYTSHSYSTHLQSSQHGTYLEAGFIDPLRVFERRDVGSVSNRDLQARVIKVQDSMDIMILVPSAMASEVDYGILGDEGADGAPPDWRRWYVPDYVLPHFRAVLPSLRIDIDESSFDKQRHRWRFGVAEPPKPCYSKPTSDLVLHLRDALTHPTGLLVNIGAGDGKGNDPLRELLTESNVSNHTPDALSSRSAGVFIESDPMLFPQLAKNLQGLNRLVPVHAKVTPSNAWTLVSSGFQQLSHVAASQSLHQRQQSQKRLAIDFLKIDIDGYDCVVLEELLDHLDPSFVFLEINAGIPPPFQFVRHFHEEWYWHPTNYSFHEVQPWIPSFSCSLTYAVRRLANRKLWLFQLHGNDAVFAKASLSATMWETFGVRMPYDEVACYREQYIWSSFPIEFVRAWFFGSDVYGNLQWLYRNLTRAHQALDIDGPWALFL